MLGVPGTNTVVAVVLALVAALLRIGGLAPEAPPPDPFVYVSFGDSYVSGPLVFPHDDSFVPQACAQSTRNYPHIASELLNVDVFRDVSCQGATINKFQEPQDVVQEITPAQFDALDETVDAVTLTMGGNDVGFVGLAVDCGRINPNDAPCWPSFIDENGVDTVSRDIVEMGDELAVALDALHLRAPNAEVFVVSYPAALPDNGKGCWPYIPILDPDMKYLSDKFKEMNAELKSTALAHDAHYVDIYTAGIGHDACQPPGVAWVNGLVPVPPSFPAHPNDLSYLSSGPIVANAIAAALA